MLFRKRIASAVFTPLAILICLISILPLKTYAEPVALYLGGFPAGFNLSTKTVEVIGLCDVLTADGMRSPAKDGGIKCGDVIDKINGLNVDKASDINKILENEYKNYKVNVIRNGETLILDVIPAKDFTTGSKRLGVLVKDSLSGIGTVTYVDKTNKKFASLGHPVTDNNNVPIEINGGTVFGCMIYDVKKGVRGYPGELHGAFESFNVLGEVTINCDCGVYGKLNDSFDTSNLIQIEKGSIYDAKIGKACIYATVTGTEITKYDVSIVKTDISNKDNRNYVIKIDDESLIEKTGGIVQGMSGSPIVQNGKIVGAVTHVFVNDPTRGYGISIDKMFSSY